MKYDERTKQIIQWSRTGNEHQSKKLRKGANILVATPGQLVYYMRSKIIRNGYNNYLNSNISRVMRRN